MLNNEENKEIYSLKPSQLLDSKTLELYKEYLENDNTMLKTLNIWDLRDRNRNIIREVMQDRITKKILKQGDKEIKYLHQLSGKYYRNAYNNIIYEIREYEKELLEKRINDAKNTIKNIENETTLLLKHYEDYSDGDNENAGQEIDLNKTIDYIEKLSRCRKQYCYNAIELFKLRIGILQYPNFHIISNNFTQSNETIEQFQEKRKKAGIAHDKAKEVYIQEKIRIVTEIELSKNSNEYKHIYQHKDSYENLIPDIQIYDIKLNNIDENHPLYDKKVMYYSLGSWNFIEKCGIEFDNSFDGKESSDVYYYGYRLHTKLQFAISEIHKFISRKQWEEKHGITHKTIYDKKLRKY